MAQSHFRPYPTIIMGFYPSSNQAKVWLPKLICTGLFDSPVLHTYFSTNETNFTFMKLVYLSHITSSCVRHIKLHFSGLTEHLSLYPRAIIFTINFFWRMNVSQRVLSSAFHLSTSVHALFLLCFNVSVIYCITWAVFARIVSLIY